MNEIAAINSGFEDLKKSNSHGVEYWSAREIQRGFGYIKWQTFESAIKKAMKACETVGYPAADQFAGASKLIEHGKGGEREVADYHLSRFACYLLAQNGDSRKPEIAHAQKYFAVQTRRQEISDKLAADSERLELRKNASEEFKALSGAARDAGVENRMFGIFHDAGYKGLYGGKNLSEIKNYKFVPQKKNLMDRMGATELAANQFRMTQTRDKLEREKIKNQMVAITTHQKVGEEVRAAIQRIGGTKPEDLPAEEHIKQVEKRIEFVKKQILLDEES